MKRELTNINVDEKVAIKLANDLVKECALLNMPCLVMMAYKNDENGTEYHNDGFLTGSNDIHLKDDKFKKVLLLLNGAEIKPMGTIDEFDDETMNYIMDETIDED